MLGRIHGGGAACAGAGGDPASNPARRRTVCKSCCTSARPRPAMEPRATRTSINGVLKRCCISRKDSRSSLRARLRRTALPILRAVTTPSLELDPGGRGSQFATKQPDAARRPVSFKRANSQPRRNRIARVRRNRRREAHMGGRIIPASGACGPHGGGEPEWLSRSCCCFGPENHAGACGGASTVDTCVSCVSLVGVCRDNDR